MKFSGVVDFLHAGGKFMTILIKEVGKIKVP
jgi:hypothetical protein